VKGYIRLLAVLVLLVCSAAVFAAESEYFVKSVPILKVYPHRDGYRIIYMKSNSDLADFYVPMRWFGSDPSSKAQIVYGDEAAYPYFSVFWKEGEFDHIRLYLEEDKTSPSWGNMPETARLSDKFAIDTLDLNF
jgi:hypothetical protein